MEAANLALVKENVTKCMGCGICRGVWERKEVAMCPVWATGVGFEDSSPRGRVTVAQDILDSHISYSSALADSVYRCTDCGCCATTCDAMDPKTLEPIVNVPQIVRAMRMDLVENSLVPPLVRDYLKAVHINGNPYKQPQEARGDWAQGCGVPQYSDQEYLFYVGDVGSYDERGQRMARSVAKLLLTGGVSLGILGSEEYSDGNDTMVMGESGLFQYLAEANIAAFKKHSVKKIISLDPHSYNAFANHYDQWEAGFQVQHYSEVLGELLSAGRLSPGRLEIKVTYHDPCYLGRHNEIYEAPRKVLSAVPGLKLVEMPRMRKNAFCCGGGGGNFFTDLIGGGASSPNRVRIREALDTGAEVVAVACPLCAKMLEDALKAESLDGRIAVKDISEILLDSFA